jgi:hypothetical protein
MPTKKDPLAPPPVTLEAVMHEMNQEDRPVSKKTGRLLTPAQIAYRDRRRVHRFYNPITGEYEKF